jgi:hypothetical protein
LGARHLAIATCVALLGCGACKRDDPDTDRVRELERRLEHCAATLERLAAIDGSERAAALARGCPYACVGLEPYGQKPPGEDGGIRPVEPLAEHCDFFCSERARQAWLRADEGEELEAVVAECGHDYYGLREDTASSFSDSFFVVHRIGVWLAQARASLPDDSELAARLDHLTANVHIPLSLPSRHLPHFELARATAVEALDAPFYVVVTESEVRAAAVRVARLRGRGIELRPVPGGSFPGELLPALDEDALEEAYREIESSLRGLHRDPEFTASPPVLLADGGLAAARLLGAASALGQPNFRLGVAGRQARAHPVVLERIPEFGSAAPAVELREGRASIPETAEPITTDDEGREPLEEALRHLVALRAPLDRIEVRVDDHVKVADLVRLADAADRARIRTIAFAAPGSE